MFQKSAAAAALLLLVAAPTLAQTPPRRIRGTIDEVAGNALTIKTDGGSDTTVLLTAKTRIDTFARKSLADVKPGDFLASTGIRGKDGKIHAIEVRILPHPAANGGRQFPWDLGADSVMTNATVGTVTKAPAGEVVHVTWKGGQSQYSIGPGVPVLAPISGSRSLLKPGAAVFAVASVAPDGHLTALFMYVESNGIKPPL